MILPIELHVVQFQYGVFFFFLSPHPLYSDFMYVFKLCITSLPVKGILTDVE